MDNKKVFGGVIAMAIGILTLVVIYTFVPTVGSQLATATRVPGYTNDTLGTGAKVGSEWNSTINPSVPTGVGLWTAMAGILKVAAIIEVIGSFLVTLWGISRTD